MTALSEEPAVAHRSLRDSEAARRARWIAASAGVAWAAFAALHLVLARPLLAAIHLAAAVTCAFAVFLVRRFGVGSRVGITVAGAVSLFALVATGFLMGGLSSPSTPYIGLVPLIAAMLARRYERWAWFSGTLVAIGALAWFSSTRTSPYAATRFEYFILPFGVAICAYLFASAWRRSAEQQAATLEERESTIARQAEELRRALAVAHDMSDRKSQLVAVASHEIRGPLNGLIGSSAALEETELKEGQRQLVRTIGTAGETITHLLDDLLDLARIEAGKLDVLEAPTSVSSLLEDALDAFAHPAATKGIGLFCVVPNDLPEPVSLDAGRIAQVLRNLVGNAVKFTERGHVLVSAYRENNDLVLTVSDTGNGIPEQAIGRIFEPFEQVSDRLSDRRLGTGLGLWISRKIVEASAGTLSVESRIGEGTRFTVRFPERLLHAARMTPVPPTMTAELHTKGALTREAYETCGARVGLALVRATANVLPQFSVFDLDSYSDDEIGALAPRGEQIVIAGSVHQMARLEDWSQRLHARTMLHPVRGSRIVGTLTAAESAPQPTETETLRGRLLIVDDDPLSRQVAVRLATRLGLEVAEAPTGSAAIRAVRESTFDVVLLDLNLGDMNGIEVAHALRRETSQLPTIVGWTGSTVMADRHAMQSAGIAAVMTKPIAFAEMTAQLRRALEQRRPRRKSLQLPLVDLDRLAELRASLRSEDTFRELAMDFRKEIEPRIAKCLAAIASGDLSKIEFEAHAFSSVAGTFGASQLHVRLRSIEACARAQRRNDIESLTRDLQLLAQDTRQAFDAELGAAPPKPVAAAATPR